MQMAINFLLSNTSPGAKALVIASDISRFALGDSAAIQEWSYSEPTSGAGAVALLLSDTPHIFRIDPGAYGVHAFEVMDTCRPGPDTEAGDADLSLMAYLDCCENACKNYISRVEDADLYNSFSYLCFHTPFGGMVKGAHRHLMRKLCKFQPKEIESDFEQRVLPSLLFGQRVGNTAGASLFLALAGTIEAGDFTQPKRLGMFSYGSGCCSEFFSGVVTEQSQFRLRAMGIQDALDQRYRLSIPEYELLLQGNDVVRFGTRDVKLDQHVIQSAWPYFTTGNRLVLDSIEGYHRKYLWV
jgi:polyketide biosynthesis 3-hydroxy-3-methylglutaryl-CoA synthase-like enzyme PksG